MSDFKSEMSDFKSEMSDFKDRMDATVRELKESSARGTRELAAISASQGRLVENFVAPSASRLFRELVGLPDDASVERLAVRARSIHPRTKQVREFDVLARAGALLLVVEVKSQLSPESIGVFSARLAEVLEYYPEYGDCEVIGAVASVWVDPSLVTYAERMGLAVVAAGGELMQWVNTPGFVPTRRRARAR